MAHVTFIHGIGNKPDPEDTLNLWRRNLAALDGIDLGTEGITSNIVYWADLLYEGPSVLTAAHESVETVIDRADPDVDLAPSEDATAEEEAWLESMRDKLGYEAEAPDDFVPPEDEIGAEFERIPLPWWLKRRLMRTFLRDVHHFLFDTEYSPSPDREPVHIQQEIRERVVEALEAGRELAGEAPLIVVSHSLGTVIAYDALKRVPECPAVDGLITFGSPLGLDEVQDKLHPEWSREDGYPAAKLAGDWVNVFDRLDPVAGLDPVIANDFRRAGDTVVIDRGQGNPGVWRHDAGKYMGGRELRTHLGRMLDLEDDWDA